VREFIDGAEAIGRGAIDAGCNFFAGYPITPATPILLYMIEELPKVGGIAIQAEDEIASLGICIGATMAGSRALTATSGPGISLYSENIGSAIMGEVPMVIVDVQRMGPATGAATTGAQGDIQFIRWATSGGYPIIALCPTNVAECYRLMMKAFDLSERFRVPVFLVTEKDIVLAKATVAQTDLIRVPVRERKIATDDLDFVPYKISKSAEVPPMSPFGGVHCVRFTTSSHDESGYLTKDPEELEQLNMHLADKVDMHLDEIAEVIVDAQEGAETLVISYGVSANAVRVAVELARLQGIKVSCLTVLSLWPVPEKDILAALEGMKRLLVVELNLGQYIREIERLAKTGQDVIAVNRVDGKLIQPEQILERL
jgi:2-oxoglutarate ferredoxin oxidoreductase subunit alpha